MWIHNDWFHEGKSFLTEASSSSRSLKVSCILYSQKFLCHVHMATPPPPPAVSEITRSEPVASYLKYESTNTRHAEHFHSETNWIVFALSLNRMKRIFTSCGQKQRDVWCYTMVHIATTIFLRLKAEKDLGLSNVTLLILVSNQSGGRGEGWQNLAQ
jgi:hypothetical protein